MNVSPVLFLTVLIILMLILQLLVIKELRGVTWIDYPEDTKEE